jgi:hypothetical protein
MKLFLASISCVAIGVAVANSATAQGPVRQGLRRTGEIAVEGTRAVAEGAGAVVRGTGEAAADVARGAGQAAAGVARGAGRAAVGVAEGAANAGRAVVGGTARGVAAGVDAITPEIPIQARAGANLQARDLDRNARWRFQQHHGDWWYYSPQNAWMYHRDGQWNQFSEDTFTPNPQFAGEYATGYRGVDAGQQAGVDPYAAQGAQAGAYAQGPVYQLHVDGNGREYICDNGQRVYFDEGQGSASGQQYGAGYRGGNEAPMTPTPAIPTDAGANTSTPGAQGQAGAQNATGAQPQTPNPLNAGSTPPAPAAPAAPTSGAAAPTGGAVQQ